MSAVPQKEGQTVTPTGKSIKPMIAGVKLRPAITIPDERGTVCEVYNPVWGFSDEPLVYIYQVTIRPGKVKGWAAHHDQDDRLFISQGTLRIVLYDDRADSPTHKMVNVFFLGEVNRGLLLIPHGVYHAVENVGYTDALFVNAPTKPYDHTNPDKYRLPLENDLIPFHFAKEQGW